MKKKFSNQVTGSYKILENIRESQVLWCFPLVKILYPDQIKLTFRQRILHIFTQTAKRTILFQKSSSSSLPLLSLKSVEIFVHMPNDIYIFFKFRYLVSSTTSLSDKFSTRVPTDTLFVAVRKLPSRFYLFEFSYLIAASAVSSFDSFKLNSVPFIFMTKKAL